MPYFLDHAVQIMEHFGVGETDKGDAERTDGVLAFLVVGDTVLGEMGTAVQFYRQPLLGAEEIDDIRADTELTPELVAAELAIPQAFPQYRFGVGLALSQGATLDGLFGLVIYLGHDGVC